MSYLAQFTTARQAARTEDKRQASQLAEARRAERLDVIREFIQLTQERHTPRRGPLRGTGLDLRRHA
ncbi:hypothetical protein GCM10022295_27030 [Streptomyces osmaniensis]|uniref:Uncharacterized protein n=2 Tax=Streptomyces osmaniensis TaxID=593134 RepID=A0ABP6W3N3_9ACTN